MERLFGTDGIRATFGQHPLTKDFIIKLGKAIGCILDKRQKKPSLSIATDTRPSGEKIKDYLIEGIKRYPIHVYWAGVLPTPAISYLNRKHNINLGIIISASHNLAEDNGIKLFSQEGFKISQFLEQEIEGLIKNKSFKEKEDSGCIIEDKNKQFIDDYVNFVKATVDNLDLSNIKIIIDSAQGAVCHIADRIFKELGAEIIALNNDAIGKRINLNSGSQYPDICKEKVLENNADIGFSFDGDGDRVILTDETGQVRDGDYIMAIAALYLQDKNDLNKNEVVSTIMSNIGLEKILKENNIKLTRTKVGDRYVVEKLVENDLNLGGEQSGHIVFLDYNNTGDGIVTALQILKIMEERQSSLGQLSKYMKKYPQVLINVKVKTKKDFSQIPDLKQAIKDTKRQLKDNGRLVLRYSGTEPLARIMIEGSSYQLIEKMAQTIAQIIKKNIGVD